MREALHPSLPRRPSLRLRRRAQGSSLTCDHGQLTYTPPTKHPDQGWVRDMTQISHVVHVAGQVPIGTAPGVTISHYLFMSGDGRTPGVVPSGSTSSGDAHGGFFPAAQMKAWVLHLYLAWDEVAVANIGEVYRHFPHISKGVRYWTLSYLLTASISVIAGLAFLILGLDRLVSDWPISAMIVFAGAVCGAAGCRNFADYISSYRSDNPLDQ